MDLPAHAIALVLVAAALHAGWNAWTKASGDPLLTLAVMIGASAACGGALAAFVGVPDRAAWPYLGASMAVHGLYHVFLWQAYRFGDLSHVYPLARGISPLLVGALSAAFVDEWLQPAQLAGLLLGSSAIVSLAFAGGGAPGTRQAVAFALATGASIGVYSFVDGQGARLAGGALRFIAWSHMLDALPIGAIAWALRRGQISRHLRLQGGRAAAAGVAGMAAYAIVLWAMTLGPMAQVSMLRETSVIFAALIGSRLLREPFGARRIAAAVAVCLGVGLLIAA